MKIDIWFDDGRCSCCYAPSFDRNLVIAKEDEQIWAEYLTKKIGELLTSDAVDTPEFKMAEEKVRKDRERALNYELRREKEREDYHRRKVMARPKITFIPKGLTVDYEKEYAVFFDQEVTYCPIDSDDFLYQVRLMNRWQDKSVPQIIEMGRPDAAYAIAIELCRHIPLFLNRDDLQEYIQENKPRIKKMIVGSFSALVTAVRAWNNETERRKVCDFLYTEAKRYKEWRGMTQTLIALMPSAAFEGEPKAVIREMSEAEIYQERLRKQEEKRHMEAEKEARSLIPLNPNYEMRIFNSRNIGWDCDQIWHLMLEENKLIERFAEQGDYQEAALRFMQMTKSMCRHFVEDEHYNYFDDMYSPEYAIDDLIDLFAGLEKAGKLPVETKEYLEKAWQEIKETACYQDYGLPRKGVFEP